MNTSLVSLDMGSNDIMNEGACYLFQVLKNHTTLSALTIANHDRLHRNRLTPLACHHLSQMLE